MNKKGLSQIVTTLILIMLILVAVGGIWAVVNNFITKGTGKIGTDQFTLSLALKSVKVNYTTGLAEVRVRRNQGEGNLTGIKFIVEDDRSSEIFEEKFSSFPELAERTFDLNLSLSEFLTLNKVEKISIAPIFIGPGGSEGLGNIAGTVSGLNEGIGGDEGEEGEDEEIPDSVECENLNHSQCGTDYFLDDFPPTCNEAKTHIEQYEMIFTCSPFDTCFSDGSSQSAIEACIGGDVCYNDGSGAVCITEPLVCSPENVSTDCGVDDWVPMLLECNLDMNATVQDYETYTCDAGTCGSSTESLIVEDCPVGQECHLMPSGAECFVAEECENNNDCLIDPNFGAGFVCEDGFCVAELTTNAGNVGTAWPPGSAEYFESSDLPAEMGDVVAGYYVVFPGSAETRCLNVAEFIIQAGVSYVRFIQAPTNVSNGDSYEVWETDYICSQI